MTRPHRRLMSVAGLIAVLGLTGVACEEGTPGDEVEQELDENVGDEGEGEDS